MNVKLTKLIYTTKVNFTLNRFDFCAQAHCSSDQTPQFPNPVVMSMNTNSPDKEMEGKGKEERSGVLSPSVTDEQLKDGFTLFPLSL